jgi:hypothetical protein
MPVGVEKLEGRWIRRTPYGVNGTPNTLMA